MLLLLVILMMVQQQESDYHLVQEKHWTLYAEPQLVILKNLILGLIAGGGRTEKPILKAGR